MVITLKPYLERQAEFLKALAHPSRLLLLEQLAGGERCVCALVADTELEQANISQHLAVLRAQGIVEARREGPRTIYRLKRPEIAAILAAVDAALAAQIAEESAAMEAAAARRKPIQGGIPG